MISVTFQFDKTFGRTLCSLQKRGEINLKKEVYVRVRTQEKKRKVRGGAVRVVKSSRKIETIIYIASLFKLDDQLKKDKGSERRQERRQDQDRRHKLVNV